MKKILYLLFLVNFIFSGCSDNNDQSEALIISSATLPEAVINIDGGCVYSWPPGLGKLVALNLDTSEIILEDNRDNV